MEDDAFSGPVRRERHEEGSPFCAEGFERAGAYLRGIILRLCHDETREGAWACPPRARECGASAVRLVVPSR